MTAKLKKKTLLLSGLIAIGIISVLQGASSFFSSSKTPTLSQNQLRDLLIVNRVSADTPPDSGGDTPNGGTGACPSPSPSCK